MAYMAHMAYMPDVCKATPKLSVRSAVCLLHSHVFIVLPRRCGHDDGMCLETPPPSIAPSCSSASSCADCLILEADLGCGWCASSNQCLSGNLAGPFTAGACEATDWWTTVCSAQDTPFNIARPAPGDVLEAGNTYSVMWTGSKPHDIVKLFFRVDGGSLQSGFGLPTGEGEGLLRGFGCLKTVRALGTFGCQVKLLALVLLVLPGFEMRGWRLRVGV